MSAVEPSGAGPGLDLAEFLREASGLEYVLIKGARTSGYEPGADLDIYCADLAAFSRRILAVGNRYVEDGRYEINVRTDDSSRHAYIDFYREGALELRFDLWGALPRFKRVRLKDSYFSRVIRDRRQADGRHGGVDFKVNIPSETDDLVLRYIEYFEWYRSRPDKVRHLDYVISSVTADPAKRIFLDRLHEYTDLPVPGEPPLTGLIRRIFRLRVRISDWARRARELGRRLRGAGSTKKSATNQ